jgi:tRNA threonylcarbamoyladenosine biosynthesis protein TsaE
VKVELPNLAASSALGEIIAARLRPGDVVALSGELGAGKTTLARAILAALGHDGEVPSPSFAIVEPYDAPPLRLPVVHADFYRLADASELAEIGLDDLREGGALIAEWPERVGGFADEPGCLAIGLEMEGNARAAIVRPGADWLGRGGWT